MSASTLLAVTRAAPDGDTSAAHYAALGFETSVTPLLEFAPLNPGLPDAMGLGAVAVTSANAIRALIETDTIAPYRHLPAFCVGTHTADAARHAGFTTIHVADGGLTDLVELIAKSGLHGPLFYPSATHLSGDLAASLAPHGMLVLKSAVYEMRAATKLPDALAQPLANASLGVIAFYSRRTADIFARLAAPLLDKSARRSFTALCLSENVAQPLLDNHFNRIALADYPSEEAMLSAARDLLHTLRP